MKCNTLLLALVSALVAVQSACAQNKTSSSADESREAAALRMQTACGDQLDIDGDVDDYARCTADALNYEVGSNGHEYDRSAPSGKGGPTDTTDFSETQPKAEFVSPTPLKTCTADTDDSDLPNHRSSESAKAAPTDREVQQTVLGNPYELKERRTQIASDE